MKKVKKVFVIVALLFTSVLSFWRPLKNVNAVSTGINFPNKEWIELNIETENYHIYKGVINSSSSNNNFLVDLSVKNDFLDRSDYFLYFWQRYNVSDSNNYNDGLTTIIKFGAGSTFHEYSRITSTNNSANIVANFGYADTFKSIPNVEGYNSWLLLSLENGVPQSDNYYEFYIVIGTNYTTLDYLIGGYSYSIGYGSDGDYQQGYNAGRLAGYNDGFEAGTNEAIEGIYEQGIEDFTNGTYKTEQSQDYITGKNYSDYSQAITDVFWKGLPTDHPLHGQYALSWWYNHNVYYEGEYYDNPYFYEIITSTDEYHNAYSQGKADAMAENPEAVGFFGILFSSIGSFLSIEILPNITLGIVLAVPLIFGIISFLIGKGK